MSNLAFNQVLASVTVSVKSEQYIFDHEPHLVEVLEPIANQKNWYWPGVALYTVENEKLEEIRRLLQISLSNLIGRYETNAPETAQSLIQLKKTISSWRLAQRLPIKVDYDLARIDTSANPRLPKGEYVLDLTIRKDSVQLFGAVNKPTEIPHIPHSDVSEYIVNQNLTELANKDLVILIQTDGRKIIAPVAYWNKKHQEAMPGSQIFVPFKESWLQPEFERVNQQIMALAHNRLW